MYIPTYVYDHTKKLNMNVVHVYYWYVCTYLKVTITYMNSLSESVTIKFSFSEVFLSDVNARRKNTKR